MQTEINVGETLRILRKQAGFFRAAELAEQLKIHEQSLLAYEQNRVEMPYPLRLEFAKLVAPLLNKQVAETYYSLGGINPDA